MVQAMFLGAIPPSISGIITGLLLWVPVCGAQHEQLRLAPPLVSSLATASSSGATQHASAYHPLAATSTHRRQVAHPPPQVLGTTVGP